MPKKAVVKSVPKPAPKSALTGKLAGWQPLPSSLKVLFVVMIIGLVLNLGLPRIVNIDGMIRIVYTGGMIGAAYKGGMILFSFMIFGYGAVILAFIINIMLTLVFLDGLWKRWSWAGKYGMGFFGFLALNSAFGFINLQGNIEKVLSRTVLQPNVSPEQMLSGALLSMQLLLISGIVLNLFFFYLVYRARKYFS